MEEEIIAELLQAKLRTEGKRVSEGLLKIDRLGSFLRKEGKSLKLPNIHPERAEDNQSER